MTNPISTVTFEYGGKTYRLLLGTWARAVLQKRTGMSWSKFFGRPTKDWGDEDFLELMIAGLSRYHEELTPREIADLLDGLGGQRAGEILTEGIGIASPAKSDGGEAKGERPTEQGKSKAA